MLRHCCLTFLIVVVITGVVAWVNQDLIAATPRIGWSNFSDAVAAAGPDAHAHTAEQAGVSPTAAGKGTVLGLVGRVHNINLLDEARLEREVETAWQVFVADEYLHIQANPGFGEVPAFALFYELDFDRGEGKVLVGYDLELDSISNGDYVSLEVPLGDAAVYEMFDGFAPESAWNAAYPNGWLLERHDMNAFGEVIDGSAWVGKRAITTKRSGG
ncbi:MAG: hypothetical protein AAF541_19880 [Pseudomonadota bacterium]